MQHEQLRLSHKPILEGLTLSVHFFAALLTLQRCSAVFSHRLELPHLTLTTVRLCPSRCISASPPDFWWKERFHISATAGGAHIFLSLSLALPQASSALAVWCLALLLSLVFWSL